MSRISLDDAFMLQALAASLRGTCPRRRVGCVLVDVHRRVVATGYNGVARGANHCIDIPCPGAKEASGTGLDACEAIHAETNALMQCRDLMAVETAYITAEPCVSCTKQLLATSCREIVYLTPYPQGTASRSLWYAAGRPAMRQISNYQKLLYVLGQMQSALVP